MQRLCRFALVEARKLLLELREEVLPGRHQVRHGTWVASVTWLPHIACERLTTFAPCAAAPVGHRVARNLVVDGGLICTANVSIDNAMCARDTR